MAKSSGDKFSKKEAARRFEEALRGAFKTQPKPLKEVPKKRETGKKPGK